MPKYRKRGYWNRSTVENFGEYSEHPIIVNDIPVSITTNGDGVNLIFSSLTCDTE